MSLISAKIFKLFVQTYKTFVQRFNLLIQTCSAPFLKGVEGFIVHN